MAITLVGVHSSVNNPLHPLLAQRWSPNAFDTSAEISQGQVASLLEAARWAPSAGNSQPWAFIAARRGEPDHQRLVPHLARSSSAWAPSASLLMVNLSHRFVEDTEWQYSEFSTYDLGQAVAHMTFQAESFGFHVHQFRAFDQESLHTEFAVPPHWTITSMSAIGKVPSTGPQDAADALDGAFKPRSRRNITDILWPQASYEDQ